MLMYIKKNKKQANKQLYTSEALANGKLCMKSCLLLIFKFVLMFKKVNQEYSLT